MLQSSANAPAPLADLSDAEVAGAAAIVVSAGIGRGRRVAVTGTLIVGRDEGCTLALADPALSRRHCAIEAADSGIVVRDLDSRNGVFVNGVPVRERALADRDRIRIGDSVLLVEIPRARAESASAVVLASEPIPAVVDTVALGDSVYLRDDRRPSDARASVDLRRLVTLSNALQSAADVDAVFACVLGHALEAFSAHAGGVFVRAAADDPFRAATLRPPAGCDLAVDPALLTRALSTRSAVVTDDGTSLIVPLSAAARASSVLLVRRAASAASRRDDVQLAAAIGVVGGLALARAQATARLQEEAAWLREDARVEHNLIGESDAMRSVTRFIARVAPTQSTVLLRGESGTGKELAARAIHDNSGRRRGPFVAINCAALPESLLESELFGHERGAFTGAVAQQRGRLEFADGGTVFLDEVAELAPGLQAKLLRVLEDQIVERLGSRRGVRIDVRVVAATNVALEQAMVAGSFRRDLYFRLNVVTLTLPPLRERRSDIPLLAAYFVRTHAARCNRVVRGISPAARARLLHHDWPGNVRELSNAIERAVVLGGSDLVLPEDLPEHLLDAPGEEEAHGFHALVAASKRSIIRDALDRNGGTVAAAARDLDLQPTYLHRLMRTLRLRGGD